jgi:DUF4097 and DUF4098 domain-containing protein YvlB
MMRSTRIAGLILAAAAALQLTVACAHKDAYGHAAEIPATAVATSDGAVEVATGEETQSEQRRQGSEFNWRGQLAAGRVIEVKGVNGNVRAEGTNGGAVEVVATKRARTSDPESVRVEVLEHADGVTICAVYPTPSNAKRQNSCEAGDSWHSSTNKNDVQVDFTVRVPAGVRFSGRTVNGEVEARNIRADVKAYTVNGGVDVSTTGLARASTVNGSINVSMGRADWNGELEFETVNGTIDLRFPEGLSADVRAETLNGNITTEFPLTVQGHVSRRRLEGVIGGGGRELRLKTVNGNVEIRRAS